MKLSISPLLIASGAFALCSSCVAFAAETQQETVFISAKAPISAQEYSGSVSVVTAEEIRATGATTIAQALEGVPGIAIGITGGNAGEDIRIRGLAAEYALILIDGKRVPNTERNISSSPANRNRWVAIENIERIEVIRGAASSLYGADALSGVINIITKKATEQWQSSVTVDGRSVKEEGGNGSGINISTRGEVNDKIGVAFSVDHQADDAVLDDAGLSIRSKRRVTNTQLGFDIALNEEDSLAIDLLYGEEVAEDIDTLGSPLEVDQIKQLYSAQYNSKIGDFNAKYALSLGNTTVKQGTQDWEIADNNFNFDIDGALTDQQYLSAGVGYREEKAYRYDKDFADTFKSFTGFAQDRIDLNDEHSLTLGFSAEDHNKYGGKVSPKVYWNWSVDEQWSVKAGYSQGRISPAIREGSALYIIPAGPTRTYQGNDDLKPENSKTYEISAAYDNQDISGSVALFNSDITDLISTTSTVTGANTLVVYSNVNEAKIRGLEGSIAWQVNNSANLSFNYTYLDTENGSGTDAGKELTERPNHTANLKYTQHLSAIDTTASLSIKGVSAQYTDSANTTQIAGHGIVNLGFVKSLSKNIDLSASVKNLTDRQVFDGSEAIYVGREFRLALTGRF
ncbi:MAG: TonB-dependent receptor [Oceanospirillaceae bacterium]